MIADRQSEHGSCVARKIASFVSDLGIDASEAERPIDEYSSLDAFFARRLKRGARRWDEDPRHLATPAEGRVLVYPELERSPLLVKGSELRVSDLVPPEVGARYAGGSAAVVRLAPADYHRFHFPADGRASEPKRLGGPLHSVHPIALGTGVASFRNKRVFTSLDNDLFGRLVLVEVGAMLVGRIDQVFAPGPVRRGDEKGTFRFGGSTVVVLVEPGRVVFDADLVEWSAKGIETFVKLGTRLGRALDPR